VQHEIQNGRSGFLAPSRPRPVACGTRRLPHLPAARYVDSRRAGRQPRRARMAAAAPTVTRPLLVIAREADCACDYRSRSTPAARLPWVLRPYQSLSQVFLLLVGLWPIGVRYQPRKNIPRRSRRRDASHLTSSWHSDPLTNVPIRRRSSCFSGPLPAAIRIVDESSASTRKFLSRKHRSHLRSYARVDRRPVADAFERENFLVYALDFIPRTRSPSFWGRWQSLGILRDVNNRQHPLEEDAA
jgi:hypothetical protein